MKPAIAFGCLLAVAACAAPSAAPGRPGGAMSPQDALAEAFEDGCLPAITQGVSVPERAEAQGWRVWKNAPATGAGPDDVTWLVPSTIPVTVTDWADGSCMVTSEEGDPARLSAQVLDAARTAGLKLTAGEVSATDGGGVRTAYCSSERPPYVLAVTTPGKSPDRIALVATLFRATGSFPSFCTAG